MQEKQATDFQKWSAPPPADVRRGGTENALKLILQGSDLRHNNILGLCLSSVFLLYLFFRLCAGAGILKGSCKTSTINLILSTRRTNVPLCNRFTVAYVLFRRLGFFEETSGESLFRIYGMSCTHRSFFPLSETVKQKS